ncbi:Ubiquitin-protein ligase [Mycena venus]|uniref:Ubiquitin-protein ligase n=1 Tax=Mycena venus TaxID=2733690 RepID=A0A8H6XM45_9AGAR|nr:Ubiquitin-protein ligase [Mycena venus]
MSSSSTPFAQAPTSKTADLDVVWPFLCAGVEHVMVLGDTLPFALYTSLYQTMYNYIFYTRRCEGGRRKPGRLQYFLTRCYAREPESNDNLVPYLSFVNMTLMTYLQKAQTVEDDSLLRYYADEWDRCTTGANYLDQLFRHLNRYSGKGERAVGKYSAYQVSTLVLESWLQHVLRPLRPPITSIILRMVIAQRGGSQIDEALVKKVVGSFFYLGPCYPDLNQECLEAYGREFEAAFLAVAEVHYSQEPAAILDADRGSMSLRDISDYLTNAERRVREEGERVMRYLGLMMPKELVSRCENVVLRAYAPLMRDVFQILLDLEAHDDLRRIYALLARLPKGLDPLRRQFATHVKAAALGAIDALAGLAGSKANVVRYMKEREILPDAHVDALLMLHQKYEAMVARSFKGDVDFTAALHQACRQLIEQTVATGTHSAPLSELLANYADALLRRSNEIMRQVDLESALNRMMVLFRFVEDKDVFLTFYTTKLSRRLIYGVGVSHEVEASVIGKLQQACGVQYTRVLQRMLTDISLSLAVTDSFMEHMAHVNNSTKIVFSMKVLGMNLWPLVPPPHDLLLPPELLPMFRCFTGYYKSQHAGRRLTWLHSYSTNELCTNYTNRRCILVTSTYQAVVVLQYNCNDTLSLQELQDATRLSREALSQVVALLVKARVLVDNGNDQYGLNPGFSPKRARLNLGLPIKAEAGPKGNDLLKSVDEHRHHIIQATIVRILKVSRMMESDALISQVIAQASEHFTPETPDIKKAMATLLEREYIERVDGSRNMFAYVP